MYCNYYGRFGHILTYKNLGITLVDEMIKKLFKEWQATLHVEHEKMIAASKEKYQHELKEIKQLIKHAQGQINALYYQVDNIVKIIHNDDPQDKKTKKR